MAEVPNVAARKRRRTQGQMLTEFAQGLGKGILHLHRFAASVRHPTAGVFYVRKQPSDSWYPAYLVSIDREGRPKGLFLLLGMKDEDEPYWISFDDRFVYTDWTDPESCGSEQTEEQQLQIVAFKSECPVLSVCLGSDWTVCVQRRNNASTRQEKAQPNHRRRLAANHPSPRALSFAAIGPPRAMNTPGGCIPRLTRFLWGHSAVLPWGMLTC
jgi:hypothetical protein